MVVGRIAQRKPFRRYERAGDAHRRLDIGRRAQSERQRVGALRAVAQREDQIGRPVPLVDVKPQVVERVCFLPVADDRVGRVGTVHFHPVDLRVVLLLGYAQQPEPVAIDVAFQRNADGPFAAGTQRDGRVGRSRNGRAVSFAVESAEQIAFGIFRPDRTFV